jgi:hypothetical protein
VVPPTKPHRCAYSFTAEILAGREEPIQFASKYNMDISQTPV